MYLWPLINEDDVLAMITALVQSGKWAVASASDSFSLLEVEPNEVPYEGYGPEEDYTGGAAGAGYLDNVGAYCVLREVNGGRRILIQRGIGETQSWSVWVADGAEFVLDEQYPLTRRPTATGEKLMIQSGAVLAAQVPGSVAVDHNYGAVGALRYQRPNGVPIENARIRVYRKSDYDQGNFESAAGITMTNVRGEWTNPVVLPTGYTYVVQFHKEGLYGPDTAEIIV